MKKIPMSHAFVENFLLEPKATGPLQELRFAIKDLIDIAGYKTGCGNPTWTKLQPPAVINAPCVDQLLYAGASCVGKTVTSQFAFDLLGEHIFFPTPLNPKAPERVPGGSSSGSASAVACGLADFALGTDTGGSVRVPASNCGIFGFRPSHGIISVAGVMPFAPTFDTIGILAKDLNVLVKAATCLLSLSEFPDTPPRYLYTISEIDSLLDLACKERFISFREQIKGLGKPRHISMRAVDREESSSLDNWYETFTTIQVSEIWSSLGSWIDYNKPELGETIQSSFDWAKTYDRSLLNRCLLKREQYYHRLNTFLGPQDLICVPTVPTPAPLKGSVGKLRSEEDYYHRALTLTSIAGIGRLPQITLPLLEIDGVPFGISLLARHGNDAFLLKAAEKLLGKR